MQTKLLIAVAVVLGLANILVLGQRGGEWMAANTTRSTLDSMINAAHTCKDVVAQRPDKSPVVEQAAAECATALTEADAASEAYERGLDLSVVRHHTQVFNEHHRAAYSLLVCGQTKCVKPS